MAHVVIIGAGIGSLAVAPLLAREGYEVTVIEKNDQPGGRASVLEADGFRFDMGPSWYLMPDVMEHYFSLFDTKPEDFFALQPLDPQYRIFFGDGEVVDIPRKVKAVRKLFESIEPGCGPQFDAYMKASQTKYDVAVKSFLYKNMNSLRDMANTDLLKYGSKLDVMMPMDKYVAKYFKSPKIQQILQYNLVFWGCSPSNAPALFSLMAHVDFNLNVWYPEKGIGSLVDALVTLGKKHGVQYIYDEPVKEIEVKNGVAVSVLTKRKRYAADIVIGNADRAHIDTMITDPKSREFTPESWEKKTLTPSAFLMYVGYKGKLPKLAHHNLYFGEDWREHCKDVFDMPRWPVEPSIYINKPSATDPTVAPKGHENLMVLVPVASGLPDNAAWKRSYADYIYAYIHKRLGVDLKSRLAHETLFSVSDFTQRYNSLNGNALGGLAHTLWQSAVWRPGNVSKKVPNLYFVGANTVPGIGVPPCLISAELLWKRMLRKHDQG